MNLYHNKNIILTIIATIEIYNILASPLSMFFHGNKLLEGNTFMFKLTTSIIRQLQLTAVFHQSPSPKNMIFCKINKVSKHDVTWNYCKWQTRIIAFLRELVLIRAGLFHLINNPLLIPKKIGWTHFQVFWNLPKLPDYQK